MPCPKLARFGSQSDFEGPLDAVIKDLREEAAFTPTTHYLAQVQYVSERQFRAKKQNLVTAAVAMCADATVVRRNQLGIIFQADRLHSYGLRIQHFHTPVNTHQEQFELKARLAGLDFVGERFHLLHVNCSLMVGVFGAIGADKRLAGAAVAVVDHDDQ